MAESVVICNRNHKDVDYYTNVRHFKGNTSKRCKKKKRNKKTGKK